VAKSETFNDLFLRATGRAPFPYQERLAGTESPRVFVNVPTGVGKTASAFFAWLWRRRFAPQSVQQQTPRRLVYCLPMRVLVEQTRNHIVDWVGRLGLKDQIGVHALMGGEESGDWDLYPECDLVLTGTQDMLLSRALNRGYGMSRYRWPMEYGLLNNDCLWVLDEVQLMGNGLATTTQLQAFREKLGTLGPAHTIWMSATLDRDWLRTVDFDSGDRSEILELSDEDFKSKQVWRVTHADKRLRKASAKFDQPKELAAEILKAHQPASRTIVILNTVRRGVDLYEQFKNKKPEAAVTLLHSRFRPPDRKRLVDEMLQAPGLAGSIIISTQVIEAGIDISASVMFTELAPWSSLVQRFGRCNRAGDDQNASVFWIDWPSENEKSARPYELQELQQARKILLQCGDVGPASLPVVKMPFEHRHVIRRKDIIELFDTTPDLAGYDIDVSRFIREDSELDVQVFWRDFKTDTPPDDAPTPHRNESCSAPIGEVRELLKKRLAWLWDGLEERWQRADAARLYPGLTLMLRAADGAYTKTEGWNPKSRLAVSDLSEGGAEQDGLGRDRWSKTDWMTLTDHTNQVVKQAAQIIRSLPVARSLDSAVIEAARWHDAGKAHQVFQDSMRRKEADNAPAELLAKCPHDFRHQRRGFRHELASGVLALMNGRNDLVAYLAASHHGKVRLSIRSLPNEERPIDPSRRFARGVHEGDLIPEADLGDGVVVPATAIRLDYMDLGGSAELGASWLARMLGLRDRPDLGPFRLALLESIVKAADERASGADTK
jgi:CRISPR-associated endonuclease/helicase Cas3